MAYANSVRLTYLSGGRATIIAFTMPIWASLLSALILKEYIGVRQIAAIFLGVLGLALLIGPELFELGSIPIGATLMLLAAMCWATATVCVKLYPWGIGVQSLAGWQLLIGGIPITVVWLLVEPTQTFRN